MPRSRTNVAANELLDVLKPSISHILDFLLKLPRHEIIRLPPQLVKNLDLVLIKILSERHGHFDKSPQDRLREIDQQQPGANRRYQSKSPPCRDKLGHCPEQ